MSGKLLRNPWTFFMEILLKATRNPSRSRDVGSVSDSWDLVNIYKKNKGNLQDFPCSKQKTKQYRQADFFISCPLKEIGLASGYLFHNSRKASIIPFRQWATNILGLDLFGTVYRISISFIPVSCKLLSTA